jgi:hypothetical protein
MHGAHGGAGQDREPGNAASNSHDHKPTAGRR